MKQINLSDDSSDEMINEQINQARAYARRASPTLLDNTGYPAPEHSTQVITGTGGNNTLHQQYSSAQQQDQQHQKQQQPPPVAQPSGGGLFSGASSLLSGATQAAASGLFSSKPKTDENVSSYNGPPMQHQIQGFSGLFGGGNQQNTQQQLQLQQHEQQQTQQQQDTQPPGQGPGFMSKLNVMAASAPGGDMLSKAKDSIFGKFGFGK